MSDHHRASDSDSPVIANSGSEDGPMYAPFEHPEQVGSNDYHQDSDRDTSLVDPAPYLVQIAEIKDLSNKRGIRLEREVDEKDKDITKLKREAVEKDKQIALLNSQPGSEHNEGPRDRKANKLFKRISELEKENKQLKTNVTKSENENHDLKVRLKSKKLWTYTAGALILVCTSMLALLLINMPCQSYINQIDDLTIQLNYLKIENIQLERTSTSRREKLIKVQEEAEQMLKGLMIQVDEEKEKSSRLDSKKTDLEKRVADLKQINVDTDRLNVELDTVQTKLSKCQTVNDDSVTNSDLSPIKLGQDFRAIYEQHYTMAIDELEGIHGESDVKATVQMFLNILKTAHNLTDIYTGQHIESMKHSTTSVEIEIPEQKSQVKMNKVYVNGTLTRMDLKDFYEIRQKCALRMLDQMTIELGEVIARQFNVDSGSQPKMMTYIKQCVGLCWKTNMHREPVYIDFYEPDGTEKFDYERFKPFMYQSGNYIDFVVWPPMFERREVHMVAKGIAERKD